MQTRSRGKGKDVSRATHACDFCHARGLKCRQSSSTIGESPFQRGCLTCRDYGVQCMMKRPIRKRGRKPREPKGADISGKQITAQNLEFGSLQAVRRFVQIYRDTMYRC